MNAALGYDEANDREQASQSYRRGIGLMQQALDLDLSVITDADTLSDIRSKKEKMQATLQHAKSRVREFTPANPNGTLCLMVTPWLNYNYCVNKK